MYVSSRQLFSLSSHNYGPKAFKKLNTNSVPVFALTFSAIFMVLCFIFERLNPSGYYMLLSMVGIIVMIIWMVSLISQIRLRRAIVKQGKKAEDVLKKLKDGGDFATLAKENSNDTANASNGGDLGWSSKEDNSFVKEFKDAAYSLSKDKTSDVVKTSFGYHIIKVLDEKDVSFDELKPTLAEKAAEEAVKKDSTIVSKALKKVFEEYNVKSSNSDVESYIKSMLEGTTSTQQ